MNKGSEPNSHRQPIGEFTGGWGVLFKIALACFPIATLSAISWGTWVTVNVLRHEERLSTPRFTLDDAATRDSKLREERANQFKAMEERIGRNYWTKREQAVYSAELNQLNQSLKVPDVRRIIAENQP